MTDQSQPLPVLYILMRNDLDSMNPGKAMAQASHASNAFVHYCHFRDHGEKFGLDKTAELEKMCNGWMGSTGQGFGTVLVLAVNERQMRLAVELAKRGDFLADIIHDPTYPIVDGQMVHHIPLDTCAWVFTPDKDNSFIRYILGGFELHP